MCSKKRSCYPQRRAALDSQQLTRILDIKCLEDSKLLSREVLRKYLGTNLILYYLCLLSASNMKTVCPNQLSLIYQLKMDNIFQILPMDSFLNDLHNIYFILAMRTFKIPEKSIVPMALPNLALRIGSLPIIIFQNLFPSQLQGPPDKVKLKLG